MQKLFASLFVLAILSTGAVGYAAPVLETVVERKEKIGVEAEQMEIKETKLHEWAEDFAWELDESTGTLTVSGHGNMPDYSYEASPWYQIRSQIKNVVIADGITSIGDSAFYGCSRLKTITIPNSVTSIGNYAFYECIRLRSTMMTDTETIQDSVTISDSITKIGEWAFYRCLLLTDITIRGNLTSIGDNAFSDCGNLTDITVLGCVTNIGNYVFYKCGSLTNITISDGLTSIGDGAFLYCSSLTGITMPDGTTRIGDNAFKYCSNLLSVTVPDSITDIGTGAFDGTAWYDAQPDGLLYINRVLYKYKGEMPNETGIDIRSGTVSVSGSAITYCNKLKSVAIPESVTYIGACAFANCRYLTKIVVDQNNPNYRSDSFGVLFNKDTTELIQAPGVIEKYTIPASVIHIGESAFSGCDSLTNITLPTAVTSIGDWAFSGCGGLKSITIPSSVMSIGSFAFSDCRSLTNITIPDGVTSISSFAFGDCRRV